jgi:hypothetical protein
MVNGLFKFDVIPIKNGCELVFNFGVNLKNKS